MLSDVMLSFRDFKIPVTLTNFKPKKLLFFNSNNALMKQETKAIPIMRNILLQVLRNKVKHLLVVFYAPWYGLPKTVKEEYTKSWDDFTRTLEDPEPNSSSSCEYGYFYDNYLGVNSKFEKYRRAFFGSIDDEYTASYDDGTIKQDKVLVMTHQERKSFQFSDKIDYQNYLDCMKELLVPEATNKNVQLQDTFFENNLYDIYQQIRPDIIANSIPAEADEEDWSKQKSHVVHLNSTNFVSNLRKKRHALVMFYLPTCKYCKQAKPEFIRAAEKFKNDTSIEFAAVNCTENSKLCSSYDIKGYPTIKYFSYYNKKIKTFTGPRTYNEFVSFMSNPQKPTASASPDEWMLHPSILRLNDRNFKRELQSKNIVLVMFYAPWCKYCKDMKPEYMNAAKALESEGISECLAMVDCSDNPGIADEYEIRGFPTIKLFKNGKFIRDYTGKRTLDDIKSFVKAYVDVK